MSFSVCMFLFSDLDVGDRSNDPVSLRTCATFHSLHADSHIQEGVFDSWFVSALRELFCRLRHTDFNLLARHADRDAAVQSAGAAAGKERFQDGCGSVRLPQLPGHLPAGVAPIHHDLCPRGRLLWCPHPLGWGLDWQTHRHHAAATGGSTGSQVSTSCKRQSVISCRYYANIISAIFWRHNHKFGDLLNYWPQCFRWYFHDTAFVTKTTTSSLKTNFWKGSSLIFFFNLTGISWSEWKGIFPQTSYLICNPS